MKSLFPPTVLLLAVLLAAGCGVDERSARDVPVAPLDTTGLRPMAPGDEHAAHRGDAMTPEMDMTSVPVAATPGVVEIDPVTIQNIGVRTAPVEVRPLQRTVRTTGRFEMDEQGAHTVTLKVGGWVEELHVDYEGAVVRVGQPLLELYSPELVVTQEEYLLAYRNARRAEQSTLASAREDARSLLGAARRRLAYWGLTDAQIEHLEAQGSPERTITFFAPASGEVMNKTVVEGQRIQPGQPLMQLNDLSKIWLIVDVYEQDLPWVREGTRAEIELPYQPGEHYQGRVDYLYIMLNPETRTVQARIVMPGASHALRPGMYAIATLSGQETTPHPVVPEEAVLHTGERSMVIEAIGGGRFLPREVTTGLTADGFVQVLDGLRGGEEVVTRAQFLIDSEARLQSAVGAMLSGHQHGDAPSN